MTLSIRNKSLQELAVICQSNSSWTGMESCIGQLQDPYVKECALTIIHHPTYDSAKKMERLKVAAGVQYASPLDLCETQEMELRKVFFEKMGVQCYQRANPHAKIFLLLPQILQELSSVIPHGNPLKNLASLILDYLNGGKELYLTYHPVSGLRWTSQTFQLTRLAQAYFGKRIVDVRDFEKYRYDFWIPDADDDQVFSSKYFTGCTQFYGKSREGALDITTYDHSRVLKSFQACTVAETSEILCHLWQRTNRLQVRSTTQLFGAIEDSNYHLVKVLSPTVSCIAFHTGSHEKYHDQEVMMRVQGAWVACKIATIPKSYHQCAERGATAPCYNPETRCCTRVPEEFGNAVKKWPWTNSYQLDKRTFLNLTANPPAFLVDDCSFPVEPIEGVWSDTPREFGVAPFWNPGGRRYGPELLFSTVSPALLLPGEVEKMHTELESFFKGLPKGVLALIKAYYDLNSLTLSV